MIATFQRHALTKCLLLQLCELELLVVPREAPPLPPIASWSLGAPRILQRVCDFLCGKRGSGRGAGDRSACRIASLHLLGVVVRRQLQKEFCLARSRMFRADRNAPLPAYFSEVLVGNLQCRTGPIQQEVVEGLCTGGLDVIRKEAWPFYRTISGVRLCWELEEPKGPKGLGRDSRMLEGALTWTLSNGEAEISNPPAPPGELLSKGVATPLHPCSDADAGRCNPPAPSALGPALPPAGGWLLLWWLWTGSAHQGTALAGHKAAPPPSPAFSLTPPWHASRRLVRPCWS